MKATATQLRIGLLILNIVLGLGIPSYAAYRYYSTTEPTKTSVQIVDVSKFAPSDSAQALKAGNTSQDKLRFAETRLVPTKPEVVEKVDTATPEPKKEAEPPKEGELDPGKLATDGWYYAGYILRREDPDKSFVILRKRDPGAVPGASPITPPPGSNRASLKAKTPPVRGTRQTVRGKPGPQQPLDEISFSVELRRYINAELGLDFMIFSADENQLVYGFYDEGPSKRYALKYEVESPYLSDPNRDHLSPPPKSAEEQQALDAEKKPSNIIFRQTKDYEPARKGEYEEWLGGKVYPAGDEPSKGGIRTIKPKEGETATPPAGGTPPPTKPGGRLPPGAHLTPSPKTDASSAAGPKKITPDDMKTLKEGMKGIPKDAQKQIMDELKKGGLKAAK